MEFLSGLPARDDCNSSALISDGFVRTLCDCHIAFGRHRLTTSSTARIRNLAAGVCIHSGVMALRCTRA